MSWAMDEKHKQNSFPLPFFILFLCLVWLGFDNFILPLDGIWAYSMKFFFIDSKKKLKIRWSFFSFQPFLGINY